MEYEYTISMEFHVHLPSIGVRVRYNITEEPRALVTEIDFGTVLIEPAYSPLLVICGDCTEMLEIISLTTNLDSTIGTLIWRIEYEPSITSDSDDGGIPDSYWQWIECNPETNPEASGDFNFTITVTGNKCKTNATLKISLLFLTNHLI